MSKLLTKEELFIKRKTLKKRVNISKKRINSRA